MSPEETIAFVEIMERLGVLPSNRESFRAVWDAARQFSAADSKAVLYPLWCIDTRNHLSEQRYLGPYENRAAASDRMTLAVEAGQHPILRRCRRLAPSEAMRRGFFAANVEEFFLEFGEDCPVESWADWEDEVVDFGLDIEQSFRDWADRNIKTRIFICEGDEKRGDARVPSLVAVKVRWPFPGRKPIGAGTWNATNPPGTAVRFWPDREIPVAYDTVTRSPAWNLPSGEAIVKILGWTGGCSVDHMQVLGPTSGVIE